MLDGVTTIVKVAHVRLCHSRMMFVRAYPRETQEMVFDAHERAFAFFRGACTRGIYDNMKTAVETIFVGKDRQYNRRFLQMCSHHLVEPVACTPASGWEKGQVENQVGLVRERFFTPRLRFKSDDELNAWLMDKCIAWTLQFRGSIVTSDVGLLAYRELDDALGLSAMAGERLADARTGKNARHALVGMLRQSVFGRLARYEDVNDAERLRHDPAMRRRQRDLRVRGVGKPDGSLRDARNRATSSSIP